MQDDPVYHPIGAYVYTPEHALEIGAIWEGIDRLEQRGVPLEQIGRMLERDFESAVLTLAMIGRRP